MIFAKHFERVAERMLHVPVTGLDISDQTVKFIRFGKQGKQIRVGEHGGIPIEPGVVVNGEIKEPKALAEALRGASFGARPPFRERFVIASLPEEKSFLRVVQVPRIKTADLKNALRWELSETIPLPLEEIYFDYEVIPQAALRDHLDVLTVAFPREIVDSYLAVFRAAGIVPMALELESQSIARALVDRLHPLDPVIILDIGASRTSFVMLYNGSIALTSTIPFSGKVLNQAIAGALDVDSAKAESIKKETGLRDKSASGAVRTSLQRALSPLVEETEKYTEYYRDHLAGRDGAVSDITKIVATGGDAALIGLDAYLARTLHKPVQIGDPFVALRSLLAEAVPPVPKNTALQFTTAVGLSIRDFDL